MVRRRTLRGWAVFWAVLQFALPSAAAYADALLERASMRALGSHVEAHGTKACPTSHSADCAICQLVHRLGPMPEPCVPVVIAVTIAAPASGREVSSAASARGRVSLPRAPPVS